MRIKLGQHMDNSFYSPIEPYATGWLKLDTLHTMYFEESGNANGVPVIFLHGGPGAGASPNHRRFFDPDFYRIIIFDQRGAGRSKPLGELTNNTTPHLLQDIERLRRHLAIERWLVFGGSWGSTLAIAYAEAHPERCSGLILRGIFLCRRSEIQWFLYDIRNIFPEPWRRFSEYIPPAERHDLLAAYYRRLIDPNPTIHMPAARSWSIFEGSCSTLLPSSETVDYYAGDTVALGLARIEAHYFKHDIFLPLDSLLKNIKRLRSIPAVIVQGRYDAVCPIVSADDMVQAWPEADYIVIANAGHSAFEPGIAAALIQATNDFKNRLS